MNDPQMNTTEPTPESTPFQPPTHSFFNSGGFVIALIVFGLFTTMITWSVSFLALVCGAFGAMLSVATCLMNHSKLCFKPKQNLNLEDENWAYLAIRAVFGMIFGTAVTLFAHINLVDSTYWSSVAVIALFGGFVFDRLVFKSQGQ